MVYRLFLSNKFQLFNNQIALNALSFPLHTRHKHYNKNLIDKTQIKFKNLYKNSEQFLQIKEIK